LEAAAGSSLCCGGSDLSYALWCKFRAALRVIDFQFLPTPSLGAALFFALPGSYTIRIPRLKPERIFLIILGGGPTYMAILARRDRGNGLSVFRL